MLCDEIKKARKNKNLTQLELANLTGVSRNAIINYENGYRIPPLDKLLQLNKVLDIEINDENKEYFQSYQSQMTKKIIDTFDKIDKNNLKIDSDTKRALELLEAVLKICKIDYRIQYSNDIESIKLVIFETSGETFYFNMYDINLLYHQIKNYFKFSLQELITSNKKEQP